MSTEQEKFRRFHAFCMSEDGIDAMLKREKEMGKQNVYLPDLILTFLLPTAVDEGVPVILHHKRDRRLPTFIRYERHAQWKHGAAFVYSMNPHDIKKHEKYYSSLPIPDSNDSEELQNLGLMELLPGQAIFWRSPDSSSALDDQLVAWYFDRHYLCALDSSALSHIDELEKLKSRIIGDTEKLNSGEKRGCDFERDDRAHGNSQGARCYNTSTSIQKQKKLFNPCSNVKLHENNFSETGAFEEDPGLELRRRLNFVRIFFTLSGNH